MSERRYKSVNISREIFDTYSCKLVLLAVLRKLPEDALLMKSHYDFASDMVEFGFYSKEWPEVEPGTLAPQFYFSISEADLEAERLARERSMKKPRAPGECICDMEYTGLRAHKFECPKR